MPDVVCVRARIELFPFFRSNYLLHPIVNNVQLLNGRKNRAISSTLSNTALHTNEAQFNQMEFIVSSVCFFYARGLKFIALAYQLDVESCN